MEKFYNFKVPNINTKQRIDKYIAGFIENASRTKVQKAINLGQVTVNGELVKSNYIVKPDDDIEIELHSEDRGEILPENIPLDIRYEDEYLLVINKPAGMVTHPAFRNWNGTLVNALMYYSLQKNDALSSLNGFERAGIVHRLDKDTSGLLVVAKDEVTHRNLAQQFFHKTTEREYNSIVWGKFKEKAGTIEERIGHDRRDRKKYMVVKDETLGKNAITNYEVLEEYDFLSLVKLNLKTGRTHQIRVHMAFKGHPVFGDEMYGGREPVKNIQMTGSLKSRIKNLLELMPRQALHARVLGFFHPVKKEQMRFEAELPEDMRMLLDKVKGL
ncbi:MAG: RluA family pseudouridine synthase [Bacteroidetes bacterium]|nr:RluA family pseudouridine synthase [Bacteroidota bacterium]